MLLSLLESSLNRNIAASSAALRLRQQLDGKSLCLQVNGLPRPVTVAINNSQLTLQFSDASNAQATISGSPLGLLSLARQTQAKNLGDSGVSISGDAEVAQGFSELLKAAKPDLEEELSRLVGDVAAHQLGVTAKHLLDFGKRATHTFAQNVGEYLTEESRDVPHRFEVDDFARQVDTLRDDVERAAARLTLLEKKITS